MKVRRTWRRELEGQGEERHLQPSFEIEIELALRLAEVKMDAQSKDHLCTTKLAPKADESNELLLVSEERVRSFLRLF